MVEDDDGANGWATDDDDDDDDDDVDDDVACGGGVGLPLWKDRKRKSASAIAQSKVLVIISQAKPTWPLRLPTADGISRLTDLLPMRHKIHIALLLLLFVLLLHP